MKKIRSSQVAILLSKTQFFPVSIVKSLFIIDSIIVHVMDVKLIGLQLLAKHFPSFLYKDFIAVGMIQCIRYKNSRPGVFCKKDVLRNFAKFTGKHLCQSLFFNKVACLRPATLLKKRLWHRYFYANFVKFLRTPFLAEDLWWLLPQITILIHLKKVLLIYLDVSCLPPVPYKDSD